MKLFSRKEVNTTRQFEFDLAKAICILGMVFVHCFEEIPMFESAQQGSLYYAIVTVLDAIFGAGTFMICLGIGLAYSKKNEPNDFIRRGLITLLFAYLLNLLRFVLPSCIYFLEGELIETLMYLLSCLLYGDIMQFAGLCFLLFGLLKKIKVPDWGIAIIALAMSITGSFVRFIELNQTAINETVGLFVGTIGMVGDYYFYATFPVLNWFIFPVFGYFLAKLIRRCNNMEKFYAITFPIATVIVGTYMAIAIPNRYGMMCGDPAYYFQMTTLGALIIMCGAIWAFGLHHYVSKLFNDKVKAFVTRLSVNINKTYCIHWVLIGWLSTILYIIYPDGIDIIFVALIALTIYVLSSFIAELVKRKDEKKKVLKDGSTN